MATYATITPSPITADAVLVTATLSNPSLTLTPILPVGGTSIQIRITGITRSISPATSGNTSTIVVTPSTFPVPADGATPEDPDHPLNLHRYANDETITVSGSYPLSIFDENDIEAIPTGGSDKTDTVKNVASFADLTVGEDTVFKYHADTRLFTVTYTVAYEVRVNTTTTAPPVPPATEGITTTVYTYFTESINVSQGVQNNYANGAALLQNYI